MSAIDTAGAIIGAPMRQDGTRGRPVGLQGALLQAIGPPGDPVTDYVTGGWGSGKSNGAASVAAWCALRNPPGTIGMLYGTTQETVYSVLLPRLLAHFAPFGVTIGPEQLTKANGKGQRAPWIKGLDQGANVLSLANGSTVLLRWQSSGGARGTAATSKQGFDCSWIWATEAQAFTAGTFAMLASRARNPAPFMRVLFEGLAEAGTAFERLCKGADFRITSPGDVPPEGLAKSATRWWAMQTAHNTALPPSYVAQRRAMAPAGSEDTYLKGLFVPRGGRVFTGYQGPSSDSKANIVKAELRCDREVRLLLDYGYQSPHWLVAQVQDAAGRPGHWGRDPWIVVREYAPRALGTESQARELFGQAFTEGWARNITRICSDVAGAAHSQAADGRSDDDAIRTAWRAVALAHNNGDLCPTIEHVTDPRLRSVRESVKVLDRQLCDASDPPRRLILIAESLATEAHRATMAERGHVGIAFALETYAWKAKPDGTLTDEPNTTGADSHPVDALRYGAALYRPIPIQQQQHQTGAPAHKRPRPVAVRPMRLAVDPRRM